MDLNAKCPHGFVEYFCTRDLPDGRSYRLCLNRSFWARLGYEASHPHTWAAQIGADGGDILDVSGVLPPAGPVPGFIEAPKLIWKYWGCVGWTAVCRPDRAPESEEEFMQAIANDSPEALRLGEQDAEAEFALGNTE